MMMMLMTMLRMWAISAAWVLVVGLGIPLEVAFLERVAAPLSWECLGFPEESVVVLALEGFSDAMESKDEVPLASASAPVALVTE